LNDHSAAILGIHVSYSGKFENYEVIPASVIEVPLALISVFSHTIQQELWISVSFDHVNDIKMLTELLITIHIDRKEMSLMN